MQSVSEASCPPPLTLISDGGKDASTPLSMTFKQKRLLLLKQPLFAFLVRLYADSNSLSGTLWSLSVAVPRSLRVMRE